MDARRLCKFIAIQIRGSTIPVVRQEHQTPLRKFHFNVACTLLGVVLLLPDTSGALDANANSGNGANGNSNGVTHASMDDVARMIRRNKNWEILDARSRQNGNETRYRFKLIDSTGKVKIIQVDPRKPSLQKLDQ